MVNSGWIELTDASSNLQVTSSRIRRVGNLVNLNIYAKTVGNFNNSKDWVLFNANSVPTNMRSNWAQFIPIVTNGQNANKEQIVLYVNSTNGSIMLQKGSTDLTSEITMKASVSWLVD